MTTKAHVAITLTTFQVMELDVDELVKAFGPRARTKAFLKDYACGMRKEGALINSEYEVEFETIKEPKMRRGIGSY